MTTRAWAGLFAVAAVVLTMAAVCLALWHLPASWRAPAYLFVGAVVASWIGMAIERGSRNV